MFKSFAGAMVAAAACAATVARPSRQVPSAITQNLIGGESVEQYTAEFQWYVDAIKTGKISIGLTHPNVKINETIETFTLKFNAWLIQNEGLKAFLETDPEVWAEIHAKFHAFMLNSYFSL